MAKIAIILAIVFLVLILSISKPVDGEVGPIPCKIETRAGSGGYFVVIENILEINHPGVMGNIISECLVWISEAEYTGWINVRISLPDGRVVTDPVPKVFFY